MGNYSRFVRPGAVRMAVHATDAKGQTVAEGDTDQKGLMCTAFRNTDGRWAFVVLNYADEDKTITFEVKNEKAGRWTPYVTAEGEGVNLKPGKSIKNGRKTTIPARSAVTFVSL